jgi:uncharacterized protein YybS (DUF2232 family)
MATLISLQFFPSILDFLKMPVIHQAGSLQTPNPFFFFFFNNGIVRGFDDCILDIADSFLQINVALACNIVVSLMFIE